MVSLNDSAPVQDVVLLRTDKTPPQWDPTNSYSPAFSTPDNPERTSKPPKSSRHSILPILLPPATLRPLAFRTFTKKYDLTLTSSALQSLCTFIGKHCGSEWREEGLAEKVLDRVAKQWKRSGGGLLVPGDGKELVNILRNLEGTMDAGNPQHPSELDRHVKPPFVLQQEAGGHAAPPLLERPKAIGMFAYHMDEAEGSQESKDPRRWLKVVGAFEQPRLSYNDNQKCFEIAGSLPSLLPLSSKKTQLFRQQYHLTRQRLLRHDFFQTPPLPAVRRGPFHRRFPSQNSTQQSYNLTPIANLLGRARSSHILLGLLAISPSGLLTINDLTGSIALDLQYTRPSRDDDVWFAPGMMVVVDGQYEEDEPRAESGLDGNIGVGGTVGGIFVVFGVAGPPCEKRETTLGIGNGPKDGSHGSSAGFGWVDFLGIGSERAVGRSMRSLEAQILDKDHTKTPLDGRGRIIILGEVNLDNAHTLQAVRKVLAIYAAEPANQTPMAVVLMGNFVRHAVMAGGGSGGSIEYKEYFDALAPVLSEYPTMLQNTTFVFVPGDNDPWASAFSSGVATPIPRSCVPDLFTSRVQRVFASANLEAKKTTSEEAGGEAIWSSNPTRLTLFGPAQEIVLFRDDISGRLRRHAFRFSSSERKIGVMANNDQKTTNGEKEVGADKKQRLALAKEATEVDVEREAAISKTPALKTITSGDTKVSPELCTARKLVKTILDQAHLSPFPLDQRPVLWDYAQSLRLYPLPTALVLMDTEAPPFAVKLDGCQVMNPGSLMPSNRKGVTQWMEYNCRIRRGEIKEANY